MRVVHVEEHPSQQGCGARVQRACAIRRLGRQLESAEPRWNMFRSRASLSPRASFSTLPPAVKDPVFRTLAACTQAPTTLGP